MNDEVTAAYIQWCKNNYRALKAVVHSRDINADRRPSSISINVLRDTIARVERKHP
jgi:hypothetical protein